MMLVTFRIKDVSFWLIYAENRHPYTMYNGTEKISISVFRNIFLLMNYYSLAVVVGDEPS